MRLIDLTTSHCRYYLTGPDSARYLNGQVSNDVAKCSGTEGISACVCNAKGKLEGTVNIGPVDNGYIVDFDAKLENTLPLRLEKYLISDDCEWSVADDRTRHLHVIGSSHQELSNGLEGSQVRVISQNRYGSLGHDLLFSEKDSDEVFSKLSRGTFPSASEVEAIRIENCIPKWGAELDHDILPQEAGLEVTHISFTKGCYIGQETISRIKSVGRVNRRLMIIVASELPSIFEPEANIFTADRTPESKPVGRITSVRDDGKTALAYLHRSVIDGSIPLIACNSEKSLSRPVEILQTSASD